MAKPGIHRRDFDPDQIRMTFGEHLEELRGRLIKSLIGILFCAGICFYFGRHLFAFIVHTVQVALISEGRPATLMAMEPTEPFIVYLKVCVICGLALAGPWVLWQLWLFVGAGLYPYEQKFVRYFAPASIVLFVTGVTFMFYFVMPVVLKFLIVFSSNIPRGDMQPTWMQEILLDLKQAPQLTTQPAPMQIPMRTENPPPATDDPEVGKRWTPGQMWFFIPEYQLRVVNQDGTIYWAPLQRLDADSAVATQYRLNDYISFVLALTLAFGIAFQMPIVVVFLVLLRIFRVQDLARARRYVLFGIVVAAAFLTPPDVISQLMLAGPMMLLFEAGLLVARIIELRRKDESV
jgi:Tat protein translocase TatC